MRGKRLPRMRPRNGAPRMARWQAFRLVFGRGVDILTLRIRACATWLRDVDVALSPFFARCDAVILRAWADALRNAPIVARRLMAGVWATGRRMQGHLGLVGAFRRDDAGVTMILTALFASLMLTASAFAIDFGYVYLQTRKLQGLADLAAISAASDLANAQKAAERSVALADWSEPIEVSVSTGRYIADASLVPGKRFEAGATPVNAAQVTLHSRAGLFFAEPVLGKDALDIARSGTAANAEVASFSLGTRLLAVQGGIANALLSSLTGSTVSLSVMDYNALAGADVDLFAYMDALRSHLDLQAASFDNLLQTQMETGPALDVLANLLDGDGDNTAAGALREIASAASAAPDIDFGRLVDLGVYGPQDHIAPHAPAVRVSALDIANAVLGLAQEGRQLKLDMKVAIPGLAAVNVWLAVGERPNQSPWLTVSDGREPIIRTAQSRLYVEVAVLPPSGLLKLNGVASVTVPLLIELASAEARLRSITCRPNSGTTVGIMVRPSVGHASIAAIDVNDLDNFKTPLRESPAPLVATKLLSVTGQARVDVGGANWQTALFTQREIDDRTIKTVDTGDIAAALASSLIGKLDLNVDILGLGIGLGDIAAKTALSNLLAGAAAPLDGVVNTLTGLLGVHLGQADVRVNGVRCHAAALVL